MFSDTSLLKHCAFPLGEKDSNYMYNGQIVPRVTHILSVMNDDYSADWANSLGFRHKNYREELEYYANIGTIVHELCDQILLGQEIDLSPYQREIVNAIYNCTTACKIWWKKLNEEYDVEVVFLEKELTCKYYGGTCDMLLKINGHYFIGDFKTSNHIGYKYWCQLAAYRYILETEMGYKIDGVFILQLNKKRPLYNEYIVSLLDDDCYDCYNEMILTQAFDTFISALLVYTNRNNFNFMMDKYIEFSNDDRYIPYIIPASIDTFKPYIHPAILRKKEEW